MKIKLVCINLLSIRNEFFVGKKNQRKTATKEAERGLENALKGAKEAENLMHFYNSNHAFKDSLK